MPRKPYWLHLTRQDDGWEVRRHREHYTFHHVPEPKPERQKPLLHRGKKP